MALLLPRKPRISETIPTKLVTNRREILELGGKSTIALLLAGKFAHGEDGHSPELDRLKETEFHKQDTMYKEIAAIGIQRYYDSRPNKEKAFFTEQEVKEGNGACACCSDDGNTEYTNAETGKKMLLIRTPGSWILDALNRADKNPFAPEFVDQVADEALAANVRIFTGHAGCGAGKAVLVARLHVLGKIKDPKNITKEVEEMYLTPAKIDAYTHAFAQAVTKHMQVKAPERDIQSDFIRKLNRPPFHVGRSLWLTDIDEFDASYPELPQGYVERTGGKENVSGAIKHAEVLESIAFDEKNSVGKMFSTNREEQFVLFTIAETQGRFDLLMQRAEKSRDELEKSTREKTRVEGLLRRK